MKKLLLIILLCSSLLVSSQETLEIIGTIVNSQNSPVSSASVSIPAAFLRTTTDQEGQFNLSLENVNYKIDDIIKISSTAADETINMTIGDYMKLNKKQIVLNDGSATDKRNKEKIATTKEERFEYTEAKKTLLTLNKVKQGNKISIKNYRGQTFFDERVETESLLSKEFDLNFLKDGNYFFEIEKDIQIDIIPFTISFEKGIIFLKNKENTLFKPHVKFENESVKLTQLSPNKEPVTVNIYGDYYNTYELIYTETIRDEQDIKRLYKLEKGNFKIVIKSNNKEYATLINNYD
ncbi:carboxypeptidase-like regulatory domain-containing protein [Algibacter luteus]|uniref:CarboxypepD_reg-like domain-containing protein n=1 Tax=Algibacter luteus TaxID=1178825 RepID=A0A1M6D4N5_9FLAO|nr:carboxypeptidase-like regulatory domain-containing protein [Algibacter luteus]SHI68196.1 hypothetical protein SAMN05216261_1361 [Algibacter luteus]